MKYFLLILLSINIVGCAKGFNDYKEPELAEFLYSFEEEAAYYGKTFSTHNLEIVFGPTREGVAGICKKEPRTFFDGGGTQKTIVINPNYWARVPWYVKEFAMFHELGHCLLNLGHDQRDRVVIEVLDGERTITTTVEASYMATSVSPNNDPIVYESVRDYYLDVLFTGGGVMNSEFVRVYESVSQKSLASNNTYLKLSDDLEETCDGNHDKEDGDSHEHSH